ncbi:hypothetical protein TSUD_352300 [Trifolium subterraneum]|nr:hypothetical protein TSUD_352300 [Trifolium subterraneum]
MQASIVIVLEQHLQPNNPNSISGDRQPAVNLQSIANIAVQYLRLRHRPSCIPPLRCRSP